MYANPTSGITFFSDSHANPAMLFPYRFFLMSSDLLQFDMKIAVDTQAHRLSNNKPVKRLVMLSFRKLQTHWCAVHRFSMIWEPKPLCGTPCLVSNGDQPIWHMHLI